MKNQLRELSNKEIRNYKKLGTATGNSFGMCVYMANKHVQNFQNRVIGFRIVKYGMAERLNNLLKKAGLNKEKSFNINVAFYEE